MIPLGDLDFTNHCAEALTLVFTLDGESETAITIDPEQQASVMVYTNTTIEWTLDDGRAGELVVGISFGPSYCDDGMPFGCDTTAAGGEPSLIILALLIWFLHGIFGAARRRARR